MIEFTSAFYIKLGRGGVWEEDSIKTGRLRLGWAGQCVDDINNRRWEVIERQLRVEHEGKRSSVATNDLNALRNIVDSSLDDVWITFHQAKLWWTRLVTGVVEQDRVSRFRQTALPWSDRAVNGRLLVVNDLPGKIVQLQGFRGTTCRVQYTDLLRRTLNGTRSALATAISSERSVIGARLEDAIKELHWKDFETLVDFVFRAAGWQRIGVLGLETKAFDLELREPITGRRYLVRVKSQAGIRDLLETIANFCLMILSESFLSFTHPRGIS